MKKKLSLSRRTRFPVSDLRPPSDAQALLELARRINAREENILVLRQTTAEAANAAVTEALLQGQDLLAAKARLRHGSWIDWLKGHCPRTVTIAQRYMRLAANKARVAHLDQAASIREALAMLRNGDQDQPQAPPKKWPPDIEAIRRAAQLNQFIVAHHADAWPSESRLKLAADLRALATRLEAKAEG